MQLRSTSRPGRGVGVLGGARGTAWRASRPPETLLAGPDRTAFCKVVVGVKCPFAPRVNTRRHEFRGWPVGSHLSFLGRTLGH